jgi:A/G-specific adenine glycosylase
MRDAAPTGNAMAEGRARELSALERRKARRLPPPLIKWFSDDARDLPWRRTLDPYAIWVSEIMLQQTQVKTVIPFYRRWMKSLPDVQSLSRASSQRLHKLWEGLGYYTRVRNMQKAARRICRDHAGRFPEQFEDVLALPGIGRYTAGAICSIAFNQPAPILDGNVIRVLTRVFGIAGDPKETKTNARLWQLAQALVSAAAGPVRNSKVVNRKPPLPCSDLNQSLMELGATICTPRNPTCPACPIRRSCVARRDNLIEQLPAARARPKTTLRHMQALILQCGNRYLTVQRPKGTVNGGLWEFPSIEVDRNVTQPPSRISGIPIANSERLGTVRHSITRYRITVDVYHARLTHRQRSGDSARRWITVRESKQLPFSAAHRRIADTLLPDITTR